MNRSVLLVICDFLILTLLSFVRFDSPAPTAPESPNLSQGASAPAMSNMVTTLEQALEAERERREVLTNALAAQNAALSQRMRLLEEKEENLTNLQRQLTQAERDARRLAEERTRLEKSHADAMASVQSLSKAFELAQHSTDSLQEQLTDTTREATEAKTRLQTMEDELKNRREEAREMQLRLDKLAEAKDSLADQKNQLAVELRQTEVEARMARGQVSNLNAQLSSATQEKAQLIVTASQLATNVGTLSEQSTAIRQQVARQAQEASAIRQQVARQTEQSTAIRQQIERQTRLPANTIYGDFLSNRVDVILTATTRGAFGQEVVRKRHPATVFVRDGARVFAVLHVDSTPLKIWPPEAPWTGFTAELRHDSRASSVGQFALLRRDPRVVLFPVDPSVPATLGVRVFEAAHDPSEFAEAVVIGGEEAYYGESSYRLGPQNPGYVEMERSTFRRLFGEFAPRRGDLAFSRTGRFLGILVSGDRCLLLNELETLPPFHCGEGLDAAANSEILKRAQVTLERMPYALK